MAALKPGDVVMVTKLDRLGRSTRELLDLIDRIGKAGASFRSLGDVINGGALPPAERPGATPALGEVARPRIFENCNVTVQNTHPF
jgi:hypothetical protein